MATKMKLPIIVLCILSIILSIGFVFFEKNNNRVVEEYSTEEYSCEDFSEDYSEESSLEQLEFDLGTKIEPTLVTYFKEPTYNSSKEESPKTLALTYPVEISTKKAEQIVIENATKEIKYDNEREILAKLLFCEAGGEGWDCQVYTCSAILNLSDYRGESISKMASNKNLFSVASYVWSTTPTQTQYDVIDYVLSGGRISGVKWFRSDGRYHSFGTPVTEIDGQYFSK